MLTIILWVVTVPILSIFAYFIYHFFIRIYLEAARFKKMDPTLKIYITPFSGLAGLQK